MARTTKAQVDVYQQVTDAVITALEQGKIMWRKPWKGAGLPVSLSTGKAYRGVNTLLLWVQGYSSSYWGTYKSIQDKGGQVRAKESGTTVVFWKFLRKTEKDPKDPSKTKTVTIPMLRTFKVFNSEQADWKDGKSPVEKETPTLDFQPQEEAEKLVQGYLSNQETLKFQEKGSRAFYRPSEDLVNMPQRVTFDGVEEWYSTLFHELVHSTGSQGRLKREGIVENHFFGDVTYSREELIAEMGATFLCAMAGLDSPQRFQNSAAYIQGWLEAIKGDKKLVVTAAGRAQKAVDYILG
ncbi:MAG: zincin-like metallopeptidase domain-containing protein, partial [Dehalococcoidia bacterium]|nr:zincin-like metallopeptidase domain-containing protein [Dehalococcoidia bacterium]